jgi:anti-anti-sigma factor
MAMQKWSENITVVELSDDPSFSDELVTLIDKVESEPSDVVLNLAAVSFVNSSNVARLLRLRKSLISADRRLMLCGVNTQVWGIFLVTGLDKIFTFTNDISTALATLQMGGEPTKR